MELTVTNKLALVTSLLCTKARFTASYDGQLDHDVCLRLSVRGYNRAGLSSIASTEIVDCDDVTVVVPHVVIDADRKFLSRFCRY